MIARSRALLLTAGLAASAFLLSACAPPGTPGQPGVSAGVHVGYGRSPFWRYWRRDRYYPVPVPPEVLPPEPELPIEPTPPIAVPLPEPGIDIGGGFGGGFGGDFGGDFGGGFDDF